MKTRGHAMKKNIYHGSVQQLPQPTFNGGKAHNDYGMGFYCTEEKEMAAEWAVGKGSDGWINCYEMDCENLKVLDLNGPEFCILHWLAVLWRTGHLTYPMDWPVKHVNTSCKIFPSTILMRTLSSAIGRMTVIFHLRRIFFPELFPAVN